MSARRSQANHQHHAWCHVLLIGVVALASLLLAPRLVLAADLATGKRVYEAANCVGCHKWHGGGGGGYGGTALSLRETPLERADLVEVIRCGRPATRMPYHDRSAYNGAECYGGMTRADLGADFPPKAAAFLRAEEIEAVADYVITQIQGKGEPTYQDCIAFWGEGNRECEAM